MSTQTIERLFGPNEAWAKQVSEERPPERCDIGGPSAAETKAEILSYLHRSFEMIDKTIGGTNRQNLLDPNVGPYWCPNRLSAAVVVAHL